MGGEKVETEEEMESEILRRVMSLQKNMEFRWTCAIEDMTEEVRGEAGEDAGRYKTVEGALEELREALGGLRRRLEG